MSMKTLHNAKICIENLKNSHLEKSDEEGVCLTTDSNMHHKDLMSQLHLKQTTITPFFLLMEFKWYVIFCIYLTL